VGWGWGCTIAIVVSTVHVQHRIGGGKRVRRVGDREWVRWQIGARSHKVPPLLSRCSVVAPNVFVLGSVYCFVIRAGTSGEEEGSERKGGGGRGREREGTRRCATKKEKILSGRPRGSTSSRAWPASWARFVLWCSTFFNINKHSQKSKILFDILGAVALELPGGNTPRANEPLPPIHTHPP
jgi:hypothetical protein